MTISDVLNKTEELFQTNIEVLNKQVSEVVRELPTPFIPSHVIQHFVEFHIYTYEQLVPYLSDLNVLEIQVGDVSVFPIYYKNESVEEVESFRDKILDITVDKFKLCREHRLLSKSHKQIVALLTYQPFTLTQVQYALQTQQSADGVRGRISELVDSGTVSRYYFTIKSNTTEEMKSYVYHYLTNTEDRVVTFINKTLEANPQLQRVHLGDDIAEKLIEQLRIQPRFVVDLAEQFSVTENTMLSILREYNSSGIIKLFYQSVISDGKNGKFIAYLPDMDVELQILMDEVFKFFGDPRNNAIKKFQNLNRTKILSFTEISELLQMSETLLVAHLTNLRKRNKVEQQGDSVLTSTFIIK